MMKKLYRNLSISVYLLIALILYTLFIFFSNQVPVTKLEYLGILLCLSVSFIFYNKKIDTWLVRFALFFTAISDIFLLLLNDYELIGVSIFTIVQLLYAARLLLMYPHQLNINKALILRLLIIIIFQIIGLIIIDHYDLLTFITFFYFSNLFTNVIIAFIHYHLNRLFAIGLLLFLFCDIFVGLNNAQGYLPINPDSFIQSLLNLPIDLMWFFYFPSQVLITLSILTNKSHIH